MKILLSVNWLIIAAIWYLANGILHDIFVIKGHKGGYDRELLRLLMDGHVLILSGALLMVGWWILRSGHQGGAIIGLLIAAFMLLYCAMIFPFLKSIVTILISLVVCIVSIAALQKHSF